MLIVVGRRATFRETWLFADVGNDIVCVSYSKCAWDSETNDWSKGPYVEALGQNDVKPLPQDVVDEVRRKLQAVHIKMYAETPPDLVTFGLTDAAKEVPPCKCGHSGWNHYPLRGPCDHRAECGYTAFMFANTGGEP